MATWGGAEISDFRRAFGDSAFLRLRRANLFDSVETPYGRLLLLTRDGRLAVGLTAAYHPTVQALVNNVAVRRAVAALQDEGYRDPQPRFYGKAHARLIDPEGRAVCVSARATGFDAQTIRLLAGRLFGGEYPELTRLILFEPKVKKFRKLTDKYPIELRELSLVENPLRARVKTTGKRTKKTGLEA